MVDRSKCGDVNCWGKGERGGKSAYKTGCGYVIYIGMSGCGNLSLLTQEGMTTETANKTV